MWLVHRTDPRLLSAGEASRLRDLTFRHNGLMSGALTMIRATRKAGTVYRVFNADVLAGWALAYKYFPTDDFADFHVYVRRSHRRRGVATALYNAALEDYQELDTHPHDEASFRFFGEVEVTDVVRAVS